MATQRSSASCTMKHLQNQSLTCVPAPAILDLAPIQYDHFATSRHTIDAPRAVLPLVWSEKRPTSLLDVGCGVGTWARVAIELGVQDVIGLDGIPIPNERRLLPDNCFRVLNLTERWDLDRRFDMLLCLEVAEHLDHACANDFIHCLTQHSD